MRVVTIDGGFRGLGDIARSRSTAVDDFTRRIAPFDEMYERYSVLREAGEVSTRDEADLTPRYVQLAARINAHMQTVNILSSEAAVAAWRAAGEVLLRESSLWVRRVRYVIGEGEMNRGLRIFLIAAASITVFGGGMYVVYRSTKKKRRR